jgi:hypothetical protein
MNKLRFIILSLVLIGFAGGALAAPKDKSLVLHCGCVWDGEVATMTYGEITISARSRGHDAHIIGTIDACKDGEVFNEETESWEDTFSDFVRNGDDCQLSGPALGDPILACEGDPAPVAGDSCGVETI